MFDVYLESKICHRQGGRDLGTVHGDQATTEVGHMNQNLHEGACSTLRARQPPRGPSSDTLR